MVSVIPAREHGWKALRKPLWGCWGLCVCVCGNSVEWGESVHRRFTRRRFCGSSLCALRFECAFSPRFGMFARSFGVILFLWASVLRAGLCSELKVRVRLSDGQIAEELLEADSDKDSITLEYRQSDGTLITFVADFKQVRSGKPPNTPSSFILHHIYKLWCFFQ